MFGIALSKGPFNTCLDMSGLTAQQVIVLCSLHNLDHWLYTIIGTTFGSLLSVSGLENFQLQLDLCAIYSFRLCCMLI